MNLTEPDYSELLSLFKYVGKKFKHFEEIDTNWGLNITAALDFPVGALYAKDYDQAGTAYWFYDGFLSYGVYVWYLLGAVCSVITIKKGKHTKNGGNFFLEKNSEELPQKPSVCSGLFAPILSLNMNAFETEDDFIKEASRLLEGVAALSEVKEHEYSFTLEYRLSSSIAADKCVIAFEVSQGKIDEIYLGITDEAANEATRVWKKEIGKRKKRRLG